MISLTSHTHISYFYSENKIKLVPGSVGSVILTVPEKPSLPLLFA